MDDLEIELAGNRYVRECCVLIIPETWLHTQIPDATVQLAGCTLHRWDRNSDSGKNRGGGLCIYVNEGWCNNSTILDKHCSPDLEFISVRCRPFFLPRELAAVVVTAVYIPPHANVNTALSLLHNAINNHQCAHPNGAHIIAGDFNKANLKTVLPKFYQFVKCPTRGENTLDHVYSNIKRAYRAVPLPHLGRSDHLSLLLTPAYTPLCRQTKPTKKTITTWPEDALPRLQDCFEQTQWEAFYHEDLATFVDTVLSYIKYCIWNVTVVKCIRVFPNQKQWMTSQVRTLLRARDSSFRSGDRALYSAARADLRRGIRWAKVEYKRRIEEQLNNPRQVWQSIQTITNYRGCAVTPGDSDAALAEELNSFFARFESSTQHSVTSVQPPLQPPISLQHPPTHS